jgi:glutamine synthetase
MQQPQQPEQINHFFAQHGVRDVECIFPDISGYPRGKLMPADRFAAGAELRICQAIPMQAVTGEYSYNPVFPDADPDVRLLPDYRTLTLAPWASVPRAVAIHDCLELDGSLCQFAPRSTLKSVLARYAELGLQAVVAPEIEFYLTAANADPAQPLVPPVVRGGRAEVGNSAFSLNMLNELSPFWDEFRAAQATLGIQADTWIHEVGPTQYEINLLHGDPVAVADQAFLFKYAAREIALKHGLNAVFMAKPIAGSAGSSMHLHISVVDAAGRQHFQPARRYGQRAFWPLHCRPANPWPCADADVCAQRQLVPALRGGQPGTHQSGLGPRQSHHRSAHSGQPAGGAAGGKPGGRCRRQPLPGDRSVAGGRAGGHGGGVTALRPSGRQRL